MKFYDKEGILYDTSEAEMIEEAKDGEYTLRYYRTPGEAGSEPWYWMVDWKGGTMEEAYKEDRLSFTSIEEWEIKEVLKIAHADEEVEEII